MIYRYGLFRDPARGWIAGVAAGLAERFGLTAAIVRVLFVVLAIVSTPVVALILYAVLAFVLPARPLLIDSSSYRRRWRREY